MANELEPGVSRRDLLKKGAVAGGIVWSAPLILSATDVAGAMHGSPQECANYFSGMYATNGSGLIRENATCSGSLGAQACPGFPSGSTYGNGCAAVTNVNTTTNTITLAATFGTGTNQKTILDVFAYSKAGNDGCIEATVVKNADGTWTITYPTGGANNATSNVQFVFCTT